MKRLRVLVGLLLLAGLVCAGGIWAVLDALRPERGDASLTERPRPERIVRTTGMGAEATPLAPDVATIRVYGTIVDPDGEPIPDVTVGSWGRWTTTDASGTYAVVLPREAQAVMTEAFGYREGFQALDVAEDTTEVEVDFVLTPVPELRVWCAGLPDDACAGFPVECTSPYVPTGSRCHHDRESGETRCICPEGNDEVAVRGGGRAVLVDVHAREAWLDFRDTGTIVGRVVPAPGDERGCDALALRIPTALEDLPRGLLVGREVDCEPDGSFRIDGLVEGDWEVALTVHGGPEAKRLERVLVPRRVRPGAVVDVGAVHMPGGASIEGIVIDGLTDAPADDEIILAWREGAGSERVTIAGGETEADGSFRIEGLPAGTWSVAPALAPQAAVTVRLAEDQAVRGVEIVTAAATALQENGFSVAETDGRLVVDEVVDEGPAWAAGLEPGEEIVGVRVAGFDVAGAMGSRANSFTRGVLAYWDGPGITLVVRAPDGAEELVPLEW